MAKPELKALKAREEQRRASKEDLLQPRIHEEEIYVHSLDRTVLIRSISHAARQKIRNESGWGTADFDEDKFNMHAIVYSLVDPKLEESDIEDLQNQGINVVDELVTHITAHNMLGRTAELKKESKETQNSDSP